MIDTIAAFDGRIAKIEGPARSGKTECLVRRCALLIEGGQAPETILVGTATGFAAQAFRARLRRALSADKASAADFVHVSTPLSACVRALETTEARAATGRTPRLLTHAEYNFFLEDMKTTGESIRILRKMLAYFYRNMASNAPRDAWGMGGKEEVVLDHLERVLKLRGGMLEQEAPYLCSAYLKSDEGAAARGQFAYVLCDDFQNYSHAEQTSLCLMANKQVIVAGNPNEMEAVGSAYPYGKGFATFDSVRRGVEVFHLESAFGNDAVVSLTDALCDVEGMDAAYKAGSATALHASTGSDGIPTGLLSVKWNTPEDEINGMAKYIRAIIPVHEDVRESRTCVVVPNRRWASMMEKLLRRKKFNVSCAGTNVGLGGDPREMNRCQALVAYTKLNLLADPTDMVAWRSWCGFGNFLTNSDAWMGLQDYADEHGVSLYEALQTIGESGFGAKEPFVRARTLAERWRSGQDFITKNAARRGFGLLKAVGCEGLPEFEAVTNSMLGDETAEQLYAMERDAVTNPVWPNDPHVVHIATFGTLCGTEYDNIFVIGAIDGFMPLRNAFEVISTDDDRAHAMGADRRKFAATCAKAGRLLVISHFMKSQLELAERTKMQVVRVKSEGSDRVAIVRPSHFLQEAGGAAPSTIGGQALLAQYDLNK